MAEDRHGAATADKSIGLNLEIRKHFEVCRPRSEHRIATGNRPVLRIYENVIVRHERPEIINGVSVYRPDERLAYCNAIG